jgi:cyclopropane-fatty-acyl-phospholipid synthase
MTNIIKQLASHDIHQYGSAELLKFEKQLERYFEREYERWRGNKELPESYGVSSFEGKHAKKEENAEYIDPYNKEFKIYRAFLDKEFMAYTMAYYGVTENSIAIDNSTSLKHAQVEKYKLIIERADIKDGQHILDLGCGFGGFVKYLLMTFPNVTVTGINPSTVQTNYIRDVLINDSRFNLIPQYIGDISEDMIPYNSYDRVVSIGALEHFTNFKLLFKYLEKILKPGGKCFHHIIVSKDTIPNFLKEENTLMADYFPGGHIWPYSELKRHNTYLNFTDSWFVNGLNYWKTLDEWHKRFWNSIDNLYPELLTIDEVKDWNKYFSLCKTMFSPDKGMSYGNGQYLYEKRK